MQKKNYFYYVEKDKIFHKIICFQILQQDVSLCKDIYLQFDNNAIIFHIFIWYVLFYGEW